MTSLLYHSISSDLTEDKKIEIDLSVRRNREFVRNLPSYSKRKAKIVLLYAMFVFQVGQPLVPHAAAVMVSLPPAIHKGVEQDKISEASKNALKIRGGDDWKFGPGKKARGAAVGNARKARNSNIFADGFAPKQTYSHYHKLDAPLSCKKTVKVLDSQFQGNGDNPPPKDGSNANSSFSQYRGGPSPFKNFDYDNVDHTRQNVDFNNQKRMSHSYDVHAKKCFGIQENRNQQSLQKFEKAVRDFIESPQTEKINGSYRYEIPAYHYKVINKGLIVTVNATNNEFVSVRNVTKFQLDKFNVDSNLGYDSRPSMHLKLRSPKQ